MKLKIEKDMIEEWKYQQIISPSNLFKNKKEVLQFLEIPATIDDLKAFLKQCEEEELYGYCALIQNKINNEYKKQYELQ